MVISNRSVVRLS